MTLRPATARDCTRVYEINFAPDVRAVSGSSEPVPYERHAAWFADRLAMADSPFWMIEDDARAVGVVRIDRGGRISIALDATARGRGLGKRAIAAACAAWGAPVVAEIRPDNRASIATFTAAGFAKTGSPHADLLTLTWHPTEDS